MKLKNINKVLNMGDDLEDDLATKIVIEPEECTFDKENSDLDVWDDYVFIRKKLRFSIAACEKVFEQALHDLASNPSPRVVEASATIIKTLTDCTSQLLDLHTKIKAIKPKKELDSENTVDGRKNSVISSIDEILEEAGRDKNEDQLK